MDETLNPKPGEESSAQSSRKSTRREILTGLIGATGTIGLGLAWVAGNMLTRPVDATSPGEGLDESDLHLAAIANDFAARDPHAAQGLTRWVESLLPAHLRSSPARQRARFVHDILLEPSRVKRDFEREDVFIVGGWVLSRSEAGAAVYLNSLARSCGQHPTA